MIKKIKRLLRNPAPPTDFLDEDEIILKNAPSEFLEAVAFMRRQDQVMAIRQMLYPLGLIELKIDQVFFMENPFCDYNDVFGNKQGQMDLSVVNGPIRRAVEILQNEGEESLRRKFPDTDYGRLIQSVQGDRCTHANYYGRLEKLISIYKSVEANGYLGVGFEQAYIMVTAKPIEVTRMGFDIQWRKYTVFSGHHRASVLAALGYRSFKAVLLRDLLDRQFLGLIG